MTLVRATCWLGAIVDALAGLTLLRPDSTALLGFAGLRAPGAAGLPAVMAAALMFGFTAILTWAQAAPVERRAVLPITLGVILTLAAANLAAGFTGALPWPQLLPPLAFQAVLATLFVAATAITSRAARQATA